MIFEEHFFLESKHDGLRLGTLMVAPEGEPRALLQMAHGMAEHKERYLPVMRYLAERGVACVMNDHRGHGESVRSSEDLGYFYQDGAAGLAEDLHQITGWMRTRWPGKKLTLFGHSMGSLAVRAYAGKYGSDIDGLIVCGSPGYNQAARAGIAMTKALALLPGGDHRRSKLMDALLNGPFAKRFPGGSLFAWLSANQDNVRAYEADPLCGFGFTLNGYQALLNLMLAAYDPKVPIRADLPTFFVSGQDDPCAPTPAGFEQAMDNWRARGCKIVTGKMYPGLRHELLNEKNPEPIFDALATFVLNR